MIDIAATAKSIAFTESIAAIDIVKFTAFVKSIIIIAIACTAMADTIIASFICNSVIKYFRRDLWFGLSYVRMVEKYTWFLEKTL